MNITLKQAEADLADLRPFVSGNLTAQWERRGDDSVFIVRSYGVEIASAELSNFDGGLYWEVLPTAYNYSVTTSKHANVAKRVWSRVGEEVLA
jgi:hypothetical protein